MSAKEEDKVEVERVIRGGATMYPREKIRPTPLDSTEVFTEFLTTLVRGPALATLCTLAVYPTYTKWLRNFLKDTSVTEADAFGKALGNLHVGIYFTMFGFFELCDHTGLFREYRLMRTPAQEPTWKMKLRTIAEFCIGNWFVNRYLAPKAFPMFRNRGMTSGLDALPSVAKIFAHFVFSKLFNEILFAVVHRILHHKKVYSWAHKKHHTYTGSSSIAAENSDPLELVISGVVPTLGGPWFLGTHPLVALVWFAWRSEQTYEAHGGYCFYGSWLQKIGLTHSTDAAFHDFHHTENKGNFGYEYTDHMFGTMDRWIQIGRAKGYLEMSRKFNKIDAAQ